MFQIEYLKNGILPHILVECIDDGAFLDNGIADILTFLENHFGRETDPWSLYLVFLQLASTKFYARIDL